MNKSNNKFNNKVAIITGAARGIGLAIAEAFASEGAKVALCDIHEEKAEQAARQINENGNSAFGIKTDVVNEEEVSKMVESVQKQFGTIHFLVNNAGVIRSTRIEGIDQAEWDLVVDTNLKGTFLASKAVLPIMKKNKFGRIINMSSSAGRSVSTLGGAHYTTAKAGVLGFTRALAKEVAAFGITANAVCPGLIDTEMVRLNCSKEQLKAYEESFPISRLGTPQEVAKLVLFLASDANYITGASIDINGGDLMI